MVFAMSVGKPRYAWGVSVGSMNWSTFGIPLDRTLSTITKHKRDQAIPASVLLGRMSGEAVRLDCWSPPHPRGCAHTWPPESIVSRETGSGRFPLAAAWTGRVGEYSWPWKIDGEAHQLNSLDAIAIGATQLAKTQVHNLPSAIVIPNDFRQREQQKLLDACSAAGVNASLLWLPVAAALAWLDENHDRLSLVRADANTWHSLPVVHADWGRIRCSTLYVVQRQVGNAIRWMPARRRPNVSDWETTGFGWRARAGCNQVDISSIWRSIFGANTEGAIRDQNLESNILEQVACWPIKQSTAEAVDRKLAEHLSTIQSPTSIIFVGDFAAQVANGPNVSRYLHAISNCSINNIIADGLNGEDLLAKGASIFARDRIEGKTSYLDTLPNLELFVDRSHQYEWLSLLGDSDHFVAGGQQWELPNPIDGLAVRRGASSIKLVVAHDEYNGVRELQVKLERPAEQRLSARLHVSATPAQGNAKLRLETEARNEVSSRMIFANWDRMQPVLNHEGCPVDKSTFLKMQPRAYPELLPRRWSHSKWSIALSSIEDLNHRLKTEDPKSIMRNERAINLLKNRLLAKDVSQNPYDATAIGSDFKAPYKQEMLVSLSESLLLLWRTCSHLKLPAVSTVVRALGYISVDDTQFDNWLAANLRNQFQDRQCVLHTSGLALRSPKNIATLFDFVFFPEGQLSTPGANELKAVSQILRYRSDATKEISSTKCEQVIRSCLGIFERGMERGGGGYPFRWASLIVVYMLRRRMFDLDFLDPENEPATRAKELFRTAIDLHKQRRLRPLGGSVDLPAALQQMINYIDRKGSGDILMAGE